MNELWIERAGARLYTIVDGEGPTVVLLHGGLASAQSLRLWAAPLAARCRLVTPDVRGSARSRYGGELTWDLLADDVAALLGELGAARAVVGGISAGSAIALRVALRYPALVAGLVLVHPVYAGADMGLQPAQATAMAAMDAFGRRSVAEGVGVMLPMFDAAPPAIRARAPEIVAGWDAASVAATTRLLASGAQPIARAADLRAITAPALVVPGLDPQHPPELAALYAAHLPQATVLAAPLADLPPAIAALVERTVE